LTNTETIGISMAETIFVTVSKDMLLPKPWDKIIPP